jgi:hypothetical protein
MKLRVVLLVGAITLAACDSPTGPTPPTREYRIGDQVELNTQFGNGLLCSADALTFRNGRVAAVSERAIIVAEVGNPAGGFSDDEYREYAATFDEHVWPVVTANFGTPHDLEGHGRIVVFFTRAVNELTPPGEDWYVGGVFAARDLFPPEGSGRLGACPGSNYANMLYMLVPDPNGEVNGNPRHKSSELHRTVNVLAHELQHLVNASRRLYGGRTNPSDWTEETWLNEGLSQVAEELMGYAVSDLAPRQNIDIWRIAESQSATQAMSLHFYDNFHNLGHYLQNPDTTSLYGADSRAARGATWQFLRYAADRRGGAESSFWRGLVDTGSSGLANLQDALGADPLAWIHDWLVSAYVDDLVPGVQARFTQQSWDFRGLYPQLRRPDGMSYGHYPLRTRTLTDGAQTSLTLAAGTGAYLRFAVAGGDRAELVMGTGGSSCRQNGPSHTLAVGAVVEIGNAQATTFCVDGPPDGGEFILVPFNAATDGTHPVALRATGIMPPLDPDHAPGEATDPDMAEHHAAPGLRDRQYEWKVRFRDQERRELDALVPGAAVLDGQVALATSQSGETLRLMLVRTR